MIYEECREQGLIDALVWGEGRQLRRQKRDGVD